ncbi:IS5/IS1182 family transposase [Clostridium thermosuccinogenes]|uniref:IS5/IS1182 family transposase n=1 Tax=Clostridium thermosuccinogenes TaxID=84032 RepID=A0A2K2F9R6_9CLOT|nr:IS5/IS1182 family transposase [Pseudoclostridium thermosuccinogenes]PNT96652.1 IS5/IS1182 family transposase [Pseudoclostridium thermosuccinogenes]
MLYEFVSIDSLVPQDHILRKIGKYIDFSFIDDLVKDLYCHDNSRPAVDPKITVKMLLLGYLFGIRSEKQIVREVQVNLAYRWFLGYGFTDKIIDASTIISQNRRRRFNGTDIFQQIFDNIVLQAMEHKLISGKVLYTDSTHLKANANKRKFIEQQVERSVKEYVEELDKAVDEDREKHEKRPTKKDHQPELVKTKISTTDSESGYMVRDGKPKGFFYLDHRTVDIKYNIITGVFVTPGNVNDVDPYLDRLDRQIEKFHFDVKYTGADVGYFTNVICKGFADRKIQGVIGSRLGPHTKGKYHKYNFQYVKELDICVCPNLRAQEYKTTTRNGNREYISNPEHCQNCNKKDRCLIGKNDRRIVYRHIWEEYKDQVYAFTKTEKGKRIYKKKETIERSFADSKELHGLRYCRLRGLSKVSEQCLLTAVAQNIKKIAMVSDRRFSYKVNMFAFLNYPYFSKLLFNENSYYISHQYICK